MALTVTLICSLAVFVQAIATQFIGSPLTPGLNFNAPFPNLGNGPAAPVYGAAASSGGGFSVTSTSPIAPTGVSVLAENLAIEGPLSVGGQLPFLGTVGVEGALPAYGSGAVSYGCGNGNVGITSEGSASGGLTPYGLAGQNLAPNAVGPFGPVPNPAFGAANVGYGPSFGQGPGFGVGLGPGLVYNGF